MEKLRCLVPESVKRRVAESSADDLPSLSSSLVDLFLSLTEFHQLIGELAKRETGLCGKNREAALDLKQKGNQCYSTRDYSQALRCYSQALRVAPIDADDMGKNLVATLYLNRASLFHKMDLPMESLRDCSRALQVSPSYPKAWYRRGKVNATLGNYEDAVNDLTVARNMEPSLGGKKQIESELDILGQHHDRKSAKPVHYNQKSVGIPDSTNHLSDVPHQIKLHCVTTPDKGRGMASQFDIPQASLIHTEEPYAVVILKHCRETHCHYCLNELPADTIPCISCSMPLYCSQHCQVRAGGQIHFNYSNKVDICEKMSSSIEEYIADKTVGSNFDPKLECIPEHKHECQGVHWPAILPSDVVLAGRVVVKSIEQKEQFIEVPNFLETLGLCESYSKMPPESKLELNIYSIVLLFCLQHSYSSELSINGVSTSRIVILLSQIRMNSMAIVRMKSSDVYDQQDWFRKFSSGEAETALTSSVEQVRVGQALYITASLFNHSCRPNIHAYFISRSLVIRATEFVAGGCPLELSYGPQVGQWDCKDRLRFLDEQYFFRCWCHGCSEVNASDLVINGFCCVNPNCSGVVLDKLVANCEKQKPKIPETIGVESHLQVHELNDIDIKKAAHISLDETRSSLRIDSEYCLKCGSYCNLASMSEAVKKAWINLRRLQDSITLKDMHGTELSDALRSVGILRSILHAYNKGIGEAEDNLAQAFCFTGDLQPARDHCKASIEILEKLYGPDHIVIGYELVKLSSIQLCLGDCAAVDSINRLSLIFSRYYGPDAGIIFPYLGFLRRKSCHIVH
ncbi:PREDICTED: SET and MYND domain-containing protein 4 isoform X1 [Theobroma cacao]|uniref:SET and MYND domain-containing protein 4 isoform X1 n=1 Tax=Theobroma cacao TaxID=3641 RepID=A0AB32X1C8_THECC|nr:PREDICTED: SET and MYND domain-containing protein 4 isoform X1 [Theobroma cacao]